MAPAIRGTFEDVAHGTRMIGCWAGENPVGFMTLHGLSIHANDEVPLIWTMISPVQVRLLPSSSVVGGAPRDKKRRHAIPRCVKRGAREQTGGGLDFPAWRHAVAVGLGSTPKAPSSCVLPSRVWSLALCAGTLKGDTMGTVTKSDNGEKLNERIVVLVTADFKARFTAWCKERGLNPSEHVRGLVEATMSAKKA